MALGSTSFRKAHTSLRLALACLGFCWAGLALSEPLIAQGSGQSSPSVEQEKDTPPRDPATKLRLLPVTVDAKGIADVETVALEKDISRVVFYLDDVEVAKRRKVPFAVRIPIAGDRRQILRAEGFDLKGLSRGEDSVVVGRAARPLRLRITKTTMPEAGSGMVALELDISAPEPSLLERLEISIDGEVVLEQGAADFGLGVTQLSVETAAAGSVVRGSILIATLHLSDGRSLDDAVPLGEAVFREELDVRLMQLQLVVLDRSGNPIGDLKGADFEVRENGNPVTIERVFPAPDISLLLGLTVDSSGSMMRIWEATKSASQQFLEGVLSPKDRAFLVDFDVDLRLVAATTDDLDVLREGLESISPEGGTALYDSVVFSLLQFERQAGRRGLVLITDGVDAGSLTDPKRTIDLAKRFGVPVYIIALQQRGAGTSRGGGELQARVQTLRLLTDPSGGRLFRAGSMDGVAAALGQIETELRSQYVLTYYTEQEIDWRKPPKIEVKVPGKKGVKVKTIFGVDLIE